MTPTKVVFHCSNCYVPNREEARRVDSDYRGARVSGVSLSADDGFIYVISKAVIEPDDVPDAILTFDAEGELIERTTLGITFGP
jgi:hypothetical protein